MNSKQQMVLFGNKELLGVPKTAFLAASTIPPDMVLKCYDWAVSMANEGQCVISGFSSHLEREVLHFLMKGRCPIILVLARQMYKHTQWGQEHCVKWKPLTYAYANGFVFCGLAYKVIATAVIFSLRSCKASRN